MRAISSTLMIATALTVAAATNNVEAQVTTTPKPAKTGRVNANGIDYYYEIHGSGEPLLLLHGGLGSIDMFGSSVLPALAKTRQVIAVDLQGHGRTTLGDRPIDLVDIGNDLALVLDRLGFKQVDVVGYSFGGGAGLRLAVQHPTVVRRLTVISAPYAQNPKDFPRLLDRMGEFMRRPYDWSEDVKRLSMPVMLVYGDADMVRPEHIVQFYQLLGGGLKDAGWQREHMSRNRLAILPDVTHYDMFLSPNLARTILPFLDGKSGSKSWADDVK
jgi:pimeloyl-ACP methyl ester carboxylesterase